MSEIFDDGNKDDQQNRDAQIGPENFRGQVCRHA